MAEEADLVGQDTWRSNQPGFVDKGAEQAVVDLIEGRRHRLALELHLVRNPGQQESSNPMTDQRTLGEDFLSNSFVL